MHIAEVARTLMAEKNMPKHFWSEAVHTTVYIMNRIPTATVHGMTPEDLFTSKKPSVG